MAGGGPGLSVIRTNISSLTKGDDRQPWTSATPVQCYSCQGLRMSHSSSPAALQTRGSHCPCPAKTPPPGKLSDCLPRGAYLPDLGSDFVAIEIVLHP